ncbi:MAG: glutathione peroxidase [Bacteroidota bacterium]
MYDIPINALDGAPLDLKAYMGSYILFVNVASKCGFTGQYKDLETLYQRYRDKLVVIGLPCNQFGQQEPGSAEQIREFCTLNYQVQFMLTEKVLVKGANQHPLYQWLTRKGHNGTKNSKVRWNFQKYLVSPEGKLIDFWYSTTSPLSNKITNCLTVVSD